MNFKVLIVLCLVLVLVIPDSDGLTRPRLRKRSICKRYACGPYTCIASCGFVSGKYLCTVRCVRKCRTSCGKRDEPQTELTSNDDQNSPSTRSSMRVSYPIPLTNKFADYDKNKDGRIDYAEFKKTLPPVKKDREIREGFNMVDKNGDRYIDCKEFLKAKMDFGGKKPTCK